MKIVVAFDSFKGSLSAQEACEIARKAIRSVQPDCDVVSKPMADGGEGTAAAIRSAFGGRWIPVRVTGPLAAPARESGVRLVPVPPHRPDRNGFRKRADTPSAT